MELLRRTFEARISDIAGDRLQEAAREEPDKLFTFLDHDGVPCARNCDQIQLASSRQLAAGHWFC